MTISESIKSSQILSWVDVARRLSYVTSIPDPDGPPDGIVSADVYWSGLTLRVRDDVSDLVIFEWLARIFGSWFVTKDTGLCLRLASLSEGRDLPIKILRIPVATDTTVTFWPRATLESRRYFGAIFPTRPDGSVLPIYAFHSVKGGVGRTTAAMAFAYKRSKVSAPVLLVDADFEAPGISFLTSTRKREWAISFEDILALTHADPIEDFAPSLDFIVERMADQKIDGLYIVPAKRLLDDLFGFAIRPEDLAKARIGNPYVLIDLIREIARKLGCGAVVVDLRAGLVDVATQFMTDPSVERVLVSTVGGQSLAALGSMITTLGLLEHQAGVGGRQPFVLINQVPLSQLYDSNFRANIAETVGSRADNHLLLSRINNETSEASVSLGFLPHISDLIASAGDWGTYLKLLEQTQFSSMLEREMESWRGLDSLKTELAPELPDYSSLDSTHCHALQQYAERMEVAETAPGATKPLITPPLERLASDFISQVPIVIVEGAKGTGKTLTYKYLLEKNTWKAAAQDLNEGNVCSYEGQFIPLFGSVANSQALLELVSGARANVAKRLNADTPSKFTETEQNLKARLESVESTSSAWLDFWLKEIAASAGFAGGDGWQRFVEAANETACRPIVLVDGLEEVLTEPEHNRAHSDALLSLLREVPLKLREEAGRPIGLILLVRADMVAAVIAQNLAQFRASYVNYALNWRDADIKELVVWMVSNSKAIPGLWSSDWRNKTNEAQEQDLRRIWGLKLGGDDSREARTTEWVIAVLTDLTGRLIARDLVRFIGAAAKFSRERPGVTRLLSAAALKEAVQYTSQKKVEEYPKEVKQLKTIFEKFKANFQTPFDRASAASIGLSDQDLDVLEKYGVAYQEDGIFEVPELFRVGLQMRRVGARPNIISLTRRARERAKA